MIYEHYDADSFWVAKPNPFRDGLLVEIRE